MDKTATWWIIVAASLPVAGMVSLECHAAEAKPAAIAQSRIAGRITAVNPLSRTLTVEDRRFGVFSTGKTKDIAVSVDTEIMNRNSQQTLGLNELDPGQKVMVTYTMEGGRNVAQSILLKDAPASPAPAQVR